MAASASGFVGRAFYSDGEEIIVEDYGGARRLYFCGREYEYPPEQQNYNYLLVVVDAQEATIGKTDGEHISVLWSDLSGVMGKHRAGGQSQARFQRGRDESVKQWLRTVVEKTIFFSGDRELIIGGAGMTKDKFVNDLPAHISSRIVRVDSVCYTDENGLWELMKKSRYIE